jgi:hypothetical protein
MPKSINKGVLVAIPVVVTSALMLMAPMLASAQNPHFISASSDTDNDGNLTCTFKEAGLGNEPTSPGELEVTCSATADAIYQCINRGGHNPEAANKEDVSDDVSGTDTFPISSNGQSSGTVTVDAPSSTLDCPGGQVLILASVTYTNVVITDEFGNTENLDDATFTDPRADL